MGRIKWWRSLLNEHMLGLKWESVRYSDAMTTRTLFLASLATMLFVGGGCAHRSYSSRVSGPSHARFDAYLATLRRGMTTEEAAPDIILHGGLPVYSSGLSMRRQRYYGFPDGGT